jgi:hypothetical protein
MKKTFTFRLGFKDFLDAYYLSHHMRIVSNTRLIRIIAIFLLVLTFVFSSMYFLSLLVSRSVATLSLAGLVEFIKAYQDLLTLALVLIGGLLLMYLSLGLLIRFRIWLMLSRNPHIALSEYTIEITDVGIHHFTSKAESNIKWEFFNHVLEDNKYFLLVKSEDTYVTIPKRAFLENADVEQFRDHLKTRLGITQIHM